MHVLVTFFVSLNDVRLVFGPRAVKIRVSVPERIGAQCVRDGIKFFFLYTFKEIFSDI